MSFVEIILIAIGLSMDAFAVSITLGLSTAKPRLKELLIPGIYFGAFQALMPAIGYFAGMYFAERIQDFAPWIAFVLLGLIGGKMVKESFSGEEEGEGEGEEKTAQKNVFGCVRMLALSIATSIDALAVGVTFALFSVNIVVAILITGAMTFFISTCGVKIGSLFGERFKSGAEFIGGMTLVLIGVKIVVEQVFMNG